jgi:hypothetical protein
MMRILAPSFVNHSARTKPVGPAPAIRTSLFAMVILQKTTLADRSGNDDCFYNSRELAVRVPLSRWSEWSEALSLVRFHRGHTGKFGKPGHAGLRNRIKLSPSRDCIPNLLHSVLWKGRDLKVLLDLAGFGRCGQEGGTALYGPASTT